MEPAASAAIYLLSSYAAASSAAFFASDLDSPIPKANFFPFLIASLTGQSFELTRECLMEPHWHHFCCFLSVDCSWWVLLPLPCWWLLFQTVSQDYSPSHFALQAWYLFFCWSLLACGRISVALHRIVDIITCYSWRWVFMIAITVRRFGLFVSLSNRTLFSNISWIHWWRSPQRTRSYY